MIPACFNAINFVVASEARIRERVVVAKSAIFAMRMFRTLLFFTFSANALANTIFASFWKVNFAGQMSETFVRDALVLDAQLVWFAVGFTNALDGFTDSSAASFWAGALVTVIVLSLALFFKILLSKLILPFLMLQNHCNLTSVNLLDFFRLSISII